MKENELQYLKKEVQCLRDELQMLQKVGSDSELVDRSPPVRLSAPSLEHPLCHLACSLSFTALLVSFPYVYVSLPLFIDKDTEAKRG